MTDSPIVSGSLGFLLRAEELSKRFGSRTILDNISLELRTGDFILLRGENGSGKTTLLNILTGGLRPDSGTLSYTAGAARRFEFDRRRLALSPFTPDQVARLGVSRSWQDVRLFASHSVRENVLLATRGRLGEIPFAGIFMPTAVRRSERAAVQQCNELLSRLDLNGKADCSAGAISTGEAKRVAAARLLAAGAKVLFLDEPFAGLDERGASDTADLLGRLAAHGDVAIVVVDHGDGRQFLRPLVTGEWLLHDGKFHSGGNALQQPHLCLGERIERLSESVRETVLPGRARLRHFRPRTCSAAAASPPLEAVDLVLQRGSRRLFAEEDKISFMLKENEVALLEAPNGWGKSTLLRTLAGIIPLAGGEIRMAGLPIRDLAAHERRRAGLQLLPSDRFEFPSLRPAEVMRLAGATETELLHGLLNSVSANMSGGEARRLALATLSSATVTLLDEPLARLDEASSETAFSRFLKPDLGTVLIATPSFSRR